MKNSIVFMFISVLALIPLSGFTQNSYLMGVESKIDKAQSEGFKNGNTNAIQEVISSIKNESNASNTHWVEYWTTYALYNQALIEAYSQMKDEETAKVTTERAINTLKIVEKKNSEDYALLGMLKGFSLQWKSMFTIPKESGVAGKWVEKAVELDDRNPRAHYTFGNNDFYKPSMFGGGKKADSSLTQAISLFKESIPNPFMPAWGLEGAYIKLVQTKMKADEDAAALTVLEEALDQFPNSRELNQLKKKLSS